MKGKCVFWFAGVISLLSANLIPDTSNQFQVNNIYLQQRLTQMLINGLFYKEERMLVAENYKRIVVIFFFFFKLENA